MLLKTSSTRCHLATRVPQQQLCVAGMRRVPLVSSSRQVVRLVMQAENGPGQQSPIKPEEVCCVCSFGCGLLSGVKAVKGSKQCYVQEPPWVRREKERELQVCDSF